MPIYHKLGKIPQKRHTQFEKPDGGLYYEQLFGTIGFDGMSSLSYHIHRPTQVKEIGEALNASPKIAVEKNITSRKFIGFDVAPKDDFLESREPLFSEQRRSRRFSSTEKIRYGLFLQKCGCGRNALHPQRVGNLENLFGKHSL